MKKSMILVFLIAVSLLSGSALAGYNKHYSDPTGDVLLGDDDSVDCTRVKTTDQGSTVLFETWFVAPPDTSNVYSWYLGSEGLSSDYLVGYAMEVGYYTYPPSGYGMVTMSFSGNKISFSLAKTNLPSTEDFDVYVFAGSLQGYGDFCPNEAGGTDTDDDGLDDVWEFDNFGNLEQGPHGDPDGDGYTKLIKHPDWTTA
ncbi:MAG: hypothetical protein ACE5IO_08275, partial [Thermoplasmata archaeon]